MATPRSAPPPRTTRRAHSSTLTRRFHGRGDVARVLGRVSHGGRRTAPSSRRSRGGRVDEPRLHDPGAIRDPTASCSPILNGLTGEWQRHGTWTARRCEGGRGVGQASQCRWRLGCDSCRRNDLWRPRRGRRSDDGPPQSLLCEPSRNTGLAASRRGCSSPTAERGSPDVNLCADGGIQVSWAKDPATGATAARHAHVRRPPKRQPDPERHRLRHDELHRCDRGGGATYLYTVRYNNGCGCARPRRRRGADSSGLHRQRPVPRRRPAIRRRASAPTRRRRTARPARQRPLHPDRHLPGRRLRRCQPGDLCRGRRVGSQPARAIRAAGCARTRRAPDTPCSDGNACTASDVCTSGACGGAAIPPPSESTTAFASRSGGGTDVTWNPAPNSTVSDLVRGVIAALPVAGRRDELCLADNTAAALYTDVVTPYRRRLLVSRPRRRRLCSGPYGFEGVNGVPGHRVSPRPVPRSLDAVRADARGPSCGCLVILRSCPGPFTRPSAAAPVRSAAGPWTPAAAPRRQRNRSRRSWSRSCASRARAGAARPSPWWTGFRATPRFSTSSRAS